MCKIQNSEGIFGFNSTDRTKFRDSKCNWKYFIAISLKKQLCIENDGLKLSNLHLPFQKKSM